MMRYLKLGVIVGGAVALLVGIAMAPGAYAQSAGGAHPKSDYYRSGGGGGGGRRGGYSYTYEDSINTYGDSRGQYGSANSFRDRHMDRQTDAGPFDHGFFFNSGTGPHGGDSPYMN